MRVPGRPRRTIDIAFTRPKVAVFVDGCFWHGCPEHGTQSKTNSEWWRQKIAANRLRDADTNASLVEAGWRVLRFWEHENALEAVRTVVELLEGRKVDDPPGTAEPHLRVDCENPPPDQ